MQVDNQHTQWNNNEMKQHQPRQGGVAGCPPGLEYLSQIDQMKVHQKKECIEIFTGWEQRNRFEIRNALDQQFFYAQEESSCFQRQCCGPYRGFVMHVSDNNGLEVARFTREFRCCSGCCCCADSCDCAYVVYVDTPGGERLGMIRQGQTCWTPEYKIMDGAGKQVLHVQGPCCVCDCCADFEIQTMDGSQTIGSINKRWGGLAKETFTDATTFMVNFPMDLDVKIKTVLLGAAFLIDFMFFEQKKN